LTDNDNNIKVWRVSDEQGLLTLTGHEHSVHDLAVSPNGLTIASSGIDKHVRLWESQSSGEQRSRQILDVAQKIVDQRWEELGNYTQVLKSLQSDKRLRPRLRSVATRIAEVLATNEPVDQP